MKLRGPLAIGCAVLLGLVLVAGLAVLAFATVAVMGSRQPSRPESVRSERALPRPEAPAPPSGTSEVTPPVRPALLELDISMAELTLIPGEEGEPLRVEADFDAERFELVEEPGDDADGWSHRVRFGPRMRLGLPLLLGGGDHDHNRVRIAVPPGHPLRLHGKLGMGQSDLELGGLWLTSVDLDIGMGEHRVEFSRPTATALEHFALEAAMGDIAVRGLGNASPAVVRASLSMGSLQVDLDGAWRRDADVEVETSMGEVAVRSPRDVHFDVESGVALGERRVIPPQARDLPPEAPTVRLRAHASMGAVTVD